MLRRALFVLVVVVCLCIAQAHAEWLELSPRAHYTMACVAARIDESGEPVAYDLDTPSCVSAKALIEEFEDAQRRHEINKRIAELISEHQAQQSQIDDLSALFL